MPAQVIEQGDGHWLAMQVEEGKVALSAKDEETLPLDRLRPELHLSLHRRGFGSATSLLPDRIEQTVCDMLVRA